MQAPRFSPVVSPIGSTRLQQHNNNQAESTIRIDPETGYKYREYHTEYVTPEVSGSDQRSQWQQALEDVEDEAIDDYRAQHDPELRKRLREHYLYNGNDGIRRDWTEDEVILAALGPGIKAHEQEDIENEVDAMNLYEWRASEAHLHRPEFAHLPGTELRMQQRQLPEEILNLLVEEELPLFEDGFKFGGTKESQADHNGKELEGLEHLAALEGSFMDSVLDSIREEAPLTSTITDERLADVPVLQALFEAEANIPREVLQELRLRLTKYEDLDSTMQETFNAQVLAALGDVWLEVPEIIPNSVLARYASLLHEAANLDQDETPLTGLAKEVGELPGLQEEPETLKSFQLRAMQALLAKALHDDEAPRTAVTESQFSPLTATFVRVLQSLAPTSAAFIHGGDAQAQDKHAFLAGVQDDRAADPTPSYLADSIRRAMRNLAIRMRVAASEKGLTPNAAQVQTAGMGGAVPSTTMQRQGLDAQYDPSPLQVGEQGTPKDTAFQVFQRNDDDSVDIPAAIRAAMQKVAPLANEDLVQASMQQVLQHMGEYFEQHPEMLLDVMDTSVRLTPQDEELPFDSVAPEVHAWLESMEEDVTQQTRDASAAQPYLESKDAEDIPMPVEVREALDALDIDPIHMYRTKKTLGLLADKTGIAPSILLQFLGTVEPDAAMQILGLEAKETSTMDYQETDAQAFADFFVQHSDPEAFVGMAEGVGQYLADRTMEIGDALLSVLENNEFQDQQEETLDMRTLQAVLPTRAEQSMLLGSMFLEAATNNEAAFDMRTLREKVAAKAATVQDENAGGNTPAIPPSILDQVLDQSLAERILQVADEDRVQQDPLYHDRMPAEGLGFANAPSLPTSQVLPGHRSLVIDDEEDPTYLARTWNAVPDDVFEFDISHVA